jgi:hypothetical protein
MESMDGTSYDLVNRTNNGLERYNRHFNGLFNKKPSLLEFFQIVEDESRFQDQKNTIKYTTGGRIKIETVALPLNWMQCVET